MKNKQSKLFEYKDSFKDILEVDYWTIKSIVSHEPKKYTIAIPTYKRNKELEIALKSAIDQTLNPSYYNIIIVDNNPERNDETEQLISRKYSNLDNVAYYKNSKNLGMAGNWNRLFQICQTQYLVMLHDDDYLFSFFMERIDKILSKLPEAAAINCRKERWSGTSKTEDVKINDQYTKVFKMTPFSNYSHFICGAPSGCLFNVDLIREIGGFKEFAYPSLDYVLIEDLCLANKSVYYTYDKMMYYRVEENSSSKLSTQLAWLEVDERIKDELAVILHISPLVSKVIKYFEIKLRLRSINKIDKKFKYRGYTGGGRLFLVFFHTYKWLNDFFAIKVRVKRIKFQ